MPCSRGNASDARAVIIDKLLAAAAVVPVPCAGGAVFRRRLELLVGDVDLIAAEPLVVGEQRPRHRIMVLAEAEEAAEAHPRIGNLAGHLVDHHALDLA